MIVRYPDYYERFRCIAGRCEDTCCAGWEIDIDDGSYEYYQCVPGAFGRKLRSRIKEYGSGDDSAYESHGFILDENRRCPFLDEDGLCEMYRELGEDALCDVCTYTPRNMLEYGGEREVALSAACPEAGRLIFGNSEPVSFLERSAEGEIEFGESADEIRMAHWIRDARDGAIRILQDRSREVEERAADFLRYADRIQECLNRQVWDSVDVLEHVGRFSGGSCNGGGNPAGAEDGTGAGNPAGAEDGLYENFMQRMVTFSGLDSFREDWTALLAGLSERYLLPGDGAEVYEDECARWKQWIRAEKREFEYEKLLVYYAFMCLPRCVDDCDFLGKAKFCAVSYLMIRDMDMAAYFGTGKFTAEDRQRIVRIYAKEVEHSEENLNALAEDFLFEEAYRTEELIRTISGRAGTGTRGTDF